MASPTTIKVTPAEVGEFHVWNIKPESAEKTSALLQENHENHHIFFSASGFHNHIVHHLLTIYALGAGPKTIQTQYEQNKSYQRPQSPLDETVVESMSDPARFKEFLGKEKHYNNFRIFFQKQMEQKGWENTVNEFLFHRDQRADDLLGRLFAGFLHPIIHLGFGIEFNQPAIVAEALAQAAVHSDWMAAFLLKAESTAATAGSKKSKSIVQLLDEIYEDQKLSTAAHWNDDNKVRDGIIKRAGGEMVGYAVQYNAQAEGLDEKVAEMINAAAYFTGSAQRRNKQIKFDFYFIHCLNCSIFYSAFMNQPWLKTEDKVRLLEWKVRSDLAMYASRRSPEPLVDEISNYKPKEPTEDEESAWKNVFSRVVEFRDDGHASKLVRALAHGQRACAPYEEKENFRIKKDMWTQLGHMAIDSVEDEGDNWVRSAGFDEAWTTFKNRN